MKIGSAKGFAWQAKTMLRDIKRDLSRVERGVEQAIAELGNQPELEAAKAAVPAPKEKVTKYLDERSGFFSEIASRAKEAAEQATSATSAWELLPRDPPIDSILHSVKFTVTASAHAKPNWTLERFRGPGLSTPFANAQRQRVHELTIVLGAPAEPGGKALSEEQSRQLFNQRLESLRVLVVPVN